MWAHGGCGAVERSRIGSTTEHKRQEWGGHDAADWVTDHRGAPAGPAKRGPGCTQDGNQTLSQQEGRTEFTELTERYRQSMWETWKGKEGVSSLFRVLGLSTEDGGLVHMSPQASRKRENKDEDTKGPLLRSV